jgi:hypothetical protein
MGAERVHALRHAPPLARPGPVLTDRASWRRQFDSMQRVRSLAESNEPDQFDVLRHHVDKGLPCDSAKFIRKLEKMTDRTRYGTGHRDGRGRDKMIMGSNPP